MRLKVYYIDDEEVLCENFVDYFSSQSVSVTTFTDPKTAIEHIKKNPPDLLFIDYRLTFMTGDQVALAVDRRIPKFLITGDISFQTDYQFDAVFSKPYDEVAVGTLISSYLSAKKVA